MGADHNPPQTPETLNDIIASLSDLQPVTAQLWERERNSHMSRYGQEESTFALTPQLGKKGLTPVVHHLVRNGLGTQHALALATEEEILAIVGKSATPLSKRLAKALRNEAIIRITQG